MSIFDDEDSDSVPSKQANQYTPRTYEDYRALKRSNPHAFFSSRVQSRMVEDAQKLGDAFWQKKAGKEWWK